VRAAVMPARPAPMTAMVLFLDDVMATTLHVILLPAVFVVLVGCFYVERLGFVM
jgi:hypothetical protein